MSSARINALSFGAEILYRRLMSVVDDFGRFYASPGTLRGACWPTNPERVEEDEVAKWLIECASGDDPLIFVYVVKGCKYLQISNFNQQTRSKSKFPEPVINLQANDNGLITDCNQLLSTIRNSYSETKTHTQTEPEPPPNVRAFPPRKSAADLEGRTSNRFPEFWSRYPMQVERDAAAREYLSFVTVEREADVFACLDRYLASDQVARGVVSKAANWIRQQHHDNWKAVWPKARDSPNQKRQQEPQSVLSNYPKWQEPEWMKNAE